MRNDREVIDRSSWDEIKIDGWFTALIPSNWEVEDDHEVIIFDPEGFGELSISLINRGLRGRKKQKASRVIAGWAAELGLFNGQEVTMFKRSRDLLITSAEFTSDEPEGEFVYWRIFPVIGEKSSLDVSYSCPVEDRDREEAIIEAIVDSIKLIEPVERPLTKEHSN